MNPGAAAQADDDEPAPAAAASTSMKKATATKTGSKAAPGKSAASSGPTLKASVGAQKA